MTNAFRALYRFWAALLFVAVIVQVGAAGYGAFSADQQAGTATLRTSKQFDHYFGPHVALGYLIFLASLLLLLFAVGARPGGRASCSPSRSPSSSSSRSSSRWSAATLPRSGSSIRSTPS